MHAFLLRGILQLSAGGPIGIEVDRRMDIEKLQEELARASDDLRKVQAERGSTARQLDAFDRLANAQRALAKAKGEEYAAPYDIGFVPEAAVSEPRFFQTERASLLTFSAVREKANWRREDAGYGLVEIVHCCTSSFGGPGDEDIEKDPLYAKGLHAYGVFEIVNSRWKRLLSEHGGLYFPGTPGPGQRHFVFTFHDSTFQCIASDLRCMTLEPPFENVLAEVRKRGRM